MRVFIAGFILLAGCATVSDELGAPFAPIAVRAAENPVVYIYAVGNTCALRLAAPNGTYSLPLRTDGYFAFRPDPGPIQVALQVPSRERLFDFRPVASFETFAGGVHYLRCEIDQDLSKKKMIVSVLAGDRALPELEGRREIHPDALESW